jgi:hypothetical protein
MRASAVWLLAALLIPAPAAALEASRALLARVGSGGRAEAALRYALPGFPGEPARPVQASLALEPPDRARLEVAATGEQVTVRADGGEWLQPAARQVVRLSPARVAPALRWWRVLLGGGAGVREERLGARHYRLVLPAHAGAAADTAEVRLDARGLPVRLDLREAGGPLVLRLSGWRFPRARGVAGFTLTAPPGYAEVRLP